jgi:serine/threonine protein kinase
MEEGQHSGMTTTTAHTGTSRYLAHELVMEEGTVPTPSSDIYATGCIGSEVQCCDIKRTYDVLRICSH